MSNKIVSFSSRAVKDERFRQLSRILLSTTGQTNWTHCSLQIWATCSQRVFGERKTLRPCTISSLFPLFSISGKIPSSLQNGETSTFSGLRLLSSLSKPAALTAADFTSFHMSLLVDPLVSLLWNKLKCSFTCSAKIWQFLSQKFFFLALRAFTSADWSLRCVTLVFTKRLLWDVLALNRGLTNPRTNLALNNAFLTPS